MQKKIIRANQSKVNLNLSELYRYRELFWALAWRDFKVRYIQTFLGVIWAFIKPAITLLVFVVVFNKAAKIETEVPYPVFALSGMLIWNYFSSVMGSAGSSVLASQNMVKKIYFPKLILPASKALVGLVEFGIVLMFLIIMMVIYKVSLTANLLFIFLFLFLSLMCALSVGIWVSALSIRFRDFQHILPIAVQLGMYITPVAYPASLIPKEYIWLYYLNPMVGIVEGFRWSILGGASPEISAYFSLVLVLTLFISGLYFFRRTERIMADII